MNAAEEIYASIGRAEDPMHGGIGEYFVIVRCLELWLG
jgi:hypothetical protein